MFDLGWTELVVLAVVAILVVGPKELPGMLRGIGKTVSSVRKMATDFQRQFNDAIDEAELTDVKNTIESVNKINPARHIKSAINPIKQATEDLKSDISKGLLDGSSSKSSSSEKPS